MGQTPKEREESKREEEREKRYVRILAFS